MADLAELRCVPCRGGVPPLRGKEITGLLVQLEGDWEVVEEHHLSTHYPFP